MASTTATIEQGQQQYQNWMNRSLDFLKAGSAQGRTDITGGLEKAYKLGQPYLQAGQQGLTEYLNTLGLGGAQAQQTAFNKFRASPSYQYSLNQGILATQRGAAASGMVGSGAEARELQKTGQGLASQEFDAYQSKLANLAGMGERAAGVGAQMAYGAGGDLARLGLGYTQLGTGIYGDIAKSAAESKLAEALAEQKRKQNIWGNIGNIAGGSSKFALAFI